MNPDEIQIGGASLHLATSDEVAKAEQLLKVTFPPGYAEYVTTLGEGVLSNWVRVYPPWQVGNDLKKWRERITAHWFWEAGKRKLSFAQAQKCIVVADTLGGDELIVHPKKPGKLYVLPHEDEDIHVVEGSFWDAVEWLCKSGKLTKPLKSFRFEPSAKSSRREIVDEPPPKRKKPHSAAAPPSRGPEEVLVAFWNVLSAFGAEFQQWTRQSKRAKIERGEETHVLTAEDVKQMKQFLERERRAWETFALMPYEEGVYPNGEYASERRDRIDRVEIKGSKAYALTRRPDFPSGAMDPGKRKYRWVLELVDGEWRIKARQKEGAKIDSYRPTGVKVG